MQDWWGLTVFCVSISSPASEIGSESSPFVTLSGLDDVPHFHVLNFSEAATKLTQSHINHGNQRLLLHASGTAGNTVTSVYILATFLI